MIHEHHITVARTARYCTLGDVPDETRDSGMREVWYVCHGYGQLASRFLRRFAPLDDGTRLIVAPEALSRFYVEVSGASHARAPVGASWMTREDRLSEIDDYICYLDALHANLFPDLSRGRPEITVLGFSQGAATACRWAVRGAVRPDRLILWGGLIPPDLDLAASADALRALQIITVTGDHDEHVPPTALADQRDRLAHHGLEPREVSFAGGHTIDPDVLRTL